jgi:hypothetical protein
MNWHQFVINKVSIYCKECHRSDVELLKLNDKPPWGTQQNLIQQNLHLMFITLKFSFILCQFHWSQVNNLRVKCPPLKIFFSSVFNSTTPWRNLKWDSTVDASHMSLLPLLRTKNQRNIYISLAGNLKSMGSRNVLTGQKIIYFFKES